MHRSFLITLRQYVSSARRTHSYRSVALHKKRKSLARKCEDGSDPVYRSLEIELDKSPKRKFGNVQVRTIHLVPFPNALGFFFVFTRFAKSGFK
jgi:hypothetical protein